MALRHPLRGLALAGALALAVPAWAQSAQQGLPQPSVESADALNTALTTLERSPATVVAEVGNRSVTWADVVDVIRGWPTIVSGVPFQDLYQAAAMQAMQQKALAVRAESVGIDREPDTQRRIRNATDDILAQEMLRRSLTLNVTPKALHAVYDGVIAGKPGPEEVQLRVIVTDTEEEAIGVISRLSAGASFAELARTTSKDGSAEAGGELGFVALDMLSPEVGAVAFAMPVGQTTAYPVRSGNRWFVLRVDSRKRGPTPSFADTHVALERDVLHAGAMELRKQALKAVPVTYYGPAGKAR